MSSRGCANSWDVAVKLGLKKVEIEQLALFKVGNKVDIMDPMTKKWAEGYIKIVNRDDPTVLLITAGFAN